jgi:hypothetical protein
LRHVALACLLVACGEPGAGDGAGDDSASATPTLTGETSGTPQVGWLAELEEHFHGVGGTAEIVDESTLEIRDFRFDGKGIDARLFLVRAGEAFDDSVELSDSLIRDDPYDNETLTLEIPAGADWSSWNLLTLWCIPAAVSFGDGAFHPPE